RGGGHGGLVVPASIVGANFASRPSVGGGDGGVERLEHAGDLATAPSSGQPQYAEQHRQCVGGGNRGRAASPGRRGHHRDGGGLRRGGGGGRHRGGGGCRPPPGPAPPGRRAR